MRRDAGPVPLAAELRFERGSELQRARRSGALALAAVLLFAATALATQLLRNELDWQRAPLSLYLLGASGIWLKAAYVGLAAGLPLLGLGVRLALVPDARSGAPVLLFGLAGAALVATAMAHADVDRERPTFEGLVHTLAAQSTFLCVTVAMLMQSWRLRLDRAWRRRFAPSFALALVAFALLWVHAYAPGLPRGLMQKSVIALILAWLGLVAVWLCRMPPADA